MRKILLLAVLLGGFSGPVLACALPGGGAYQLASGGVIREADHAFIPDDTRNQDWSCYQAWLAVPNTPLAAISTAPAQAASDLAAKLAAGLMITSTAYPALNGTYSISATTQSDVQAVAIYIEANSKFPAGLSALPWADLSGTQHDFPTTAEFMAFATAEANYVTMLNLDAQAEAAGQTPTWPSATAAIP